MTQLHVICPVYNEEKVIAQFNAELLSVLDGLAGQYQCAVLYVLDPSSDGTEQILTRLAKRDSRVNVLVLSRRFGHQAALIAGLDHVDGDAIVMMDSDLQHPPSLIPEMIERFEAGADVVQMIRLDNSYAGFHSRIASRSFYKLLRMISSIDMLAGAADFRLLSRRAARVLRDEFKERNPFLRGLVRWIGFHFETIPFQPKPRAAGNTKYRWKTLITFAFEGLFSFSKTPLRACILLGLVTAFLGFCYGIFAFVSTLIIGRTVAGWASVLAAITFIGGVQLIFLGIIGEYIGQIYDEVKDRPRYLVDRSFGRLLRPAERQQDDERIHS